jgi:MFS family permease
VVVWGWLLYAASYAALALSRSWQLTLGLIAVYGLYYAFSEGAEKAILSNLAPPEAQGRAFGLYNALIGAAAPVAGVLFGAVWTRLSAAAAFWMAGGIAFASAVLLWACLPRARGPLPAA